VHEDLGALLELFKVDVRAASRLRNQTSGQPLLERLQYDIQDSIRIQIKVPRELFDIDDQVVKSFFVDAV
jgi:hypothetical protein